MCSTLLSLLRSTTNRVNCLNDRGLFPSGCLDFDYAGMVSTHMSVSTADAFSFHGGRCCVRAWVTHGGYFPFIPLTVPNPAFLTVLFIHIHTHAHTLRPSICNTCGDLHTRPHTYTIPKTNTNINTHTPNQTHPLTKPLELLPSKQLCLTPHPDIPPKFK